MPTGYTNDIYEGKDVSLADFAAGCAHAFGAFVHQRDSTHDGQLTYPESPNTVDNYHVTKLVRARAEADQWADMSEERKYELWSEYYRERTVELHNSIAKNSELRARYQRMLAQVQAVDVPSDLQNFKDFMVGQLTDSIEFDCGSDDKFTKEWYQPKEYFAWLDAEERRFQWDINYHTEQLAKERERYDNQIRYINLMKDAFGFEVVEAE